MEVQITISKAEANLIREWFNCVQDINPKYLTQSDYDLAAQLYKALDIPIPSTMDRRLKE